MSVCWVFLFSFTTADIDISWFYLEKGNVGGRRRELVTLYVFNHSMFHFQFNFCTKNTQSLDLDMAAIIAPQVTWQSPVEHGRRDFHRSKLWYQQPLWPQMMNCKSDRETTGPPQYKTFTQSHTGWCFAAYGLTGDFIQLSAKGLWVQRVQLNCKKILLTVNCSLIMGEEACLCQIPQLQIDH